MLTLASGSLSGGDVVEQNVPRFDWGEIIKAVIIVGIGSLVYALAVPMIGALLGGGNTGPTAGNDIFLWTSRGLLWGLIIWRGAAMLGVVGDRIVDDMLVVAAIASLVWLIIKAVVIVSIFQAVKADGTPVALVDVNDLLAVGAALLISWLGAKANTQ
jgi:hypothetical protein